MAAAATHLLWASDISPARAGRERRLLTAALYLARLAEAVARLEVREAVEAASPSPPAQRGAGGDGRGRRPAG